MAEHNVESSARLVQYDDTDWVVGGHWGAGGQVERKPKSWLKLAEEEFFPVDRTSYVWARDLQQVGWFVWETIDDIPKRAKPLALQAAWNVSIKNHPFVAVFNLGNGLWWLFGTDSVGAIHPQWGDVVGTLDDIERHISTNSAAIYLSTTYERFDTPEESWKWLLSEEKEDIPYLRPVSSWITNPKTRNKVIVAVLAIVALSSGSVLYKQYRSQIKNELAARFQLDQQRLIEKMNMERAQKEANWMQRIQAQWDSWPRPWELPNASVKDWLSFCHITDLSRGGWHAKETKCYFNGDHLVKDTTWQRSQFATLLTSPEYSDVDSSGDTIKTIEKLLIPQTVSIKQLPSPDKADVVARRWLITKQQMGNIVRINVSPALEFRPPFPLDTPDDIIGKMSPPVLYRYYEVEIETNIPPKESESWLSDPYFIIREVSHIVAGSDKIEFQWKIKGVAYAL